ncbi:MAG TPA: fatty acid desaturase [Candidatus Binatia bacterium]|jgi:fatty acid desaturase
MSSSDGGTVVSPGETIEVDHSPAALRRRYTSLFRPRPWIYYADLLASATLGWTALVLAIRAHRFSPVWCLAVFVATFALYRAVLFIHELAHLKRRSVPGFEILWSLLIGFPLLVPSLMYVGSHGEHHRRMIFGTDRDPEYQPIGQWSKAKVVGSILPLVFVPGLLVIRWGILGPLSYVIPPLRPFVVNYMSTLVINPAYKRKMPEGRMARRWMIEEGATALVCWTMIGVVVAGIIRPSWVFEWYLVSSLVLVFNHVRTLVAHRYLNDGAPMDLLEQYRDSVNLSGGSWIDAMLAPVGLRFHALHHLLPTVPYHSLGRIHRIMLSELPPSTPYHEAEHRTLLAAVRSLFGGRALAHFRAH